ncbi:hypothetical protein QQF64_020192 [Cirrhinus molitorella]|uniref:SCAN box domain-containing protein n=1 Tax=Cirrhinus molitorella TaxID=172907 RepID=A0ABR3L8L9_9TELE
MSAAQLFHDWEYKPRMPAHAQAAELTRLAQHWLLVGGPTANQVAERVVIDRLLRALPRPLRQAAGMRNPTTVDELVEAVELAEAAQHREAGERAPPFGYLATSCAVHQELPRNVLRTEVKINGRPFQALLDTGSAVSLIHPTVLPPRADSQRPFTDYLWHGDTYQAPARRHHRGRTRRLARGTTLPAPPGAPKGTTTREKNPPSHPALLASDDPPRGGVPLPKYNLYYEGVPAGDGRGRFRLRRSLVDDRLKKRRGSSRVIEGETVHPAPHPVHTFVVQNGLLYCVATAKGGKKTLLVVPRRKRRSCFGGSPPRIACPMSSSASERSPKRPRGLRLLRSTISTSGDGGEIDRVMPLARGTPGEGAAGPATSLQSGSPTTGVRAGRSSLVLAPTSHAKFLAFWQGPYPDDGRWAPSLPRIRQPGKKERRSTLPCQFAEALGSGPKPASHPDQNDPGVWVDINPHLSAAQKTELQHRVWVSSLMCFSPVPRRTNVLQHDIRTPPGVIVPAAALPCPWARRQAIEGENFKRC